MNRIAYVVLGLVTGLDILAINVTRAGDNRAQSQAAGQQRPNFTINSNGTLSFVRTRRGVEFKRPNDGFSVTYQLLDKNGKTTKGSPKEIYAIGNSISDRTMKCEVCEKGVATAGVTIDKFLKVHTNFHLDEQNGVLQVIRFIQNNSKYPVRILSAKVQIDGRLATERESRLGLVDPEKIRQARVQPDRADVMVSNFSAAIFQPFNLPCRICPPNCEAFLSGNPGEREAICVQCNEKGEIVWDLKPLSAFGTVDPATCPNPVIANGWNFVSAGFTSPPKREVICVDCPAEGGSPSQQHHTSSGGATDAAMVGSEREKGNCKFAVTIDREGDKTIARGTHSVERSMVTTMTASGTPASTAGITAFRSPYQQPDARKTGRSNTGVIPVSELKPGQVIGIANYLNIK